MSIWYEAKAEDVEVENGDVIVSFTDLAGESCYVTFDLEHLLKLLDELPDPCPVDPRCTLPRPHSHEL